MQTIVSLNNISKAFGKSQVLKDLSFEVQKGQSIALLGPNGAGKSTALSIILGLRQASSGTVSLFSETPGSAKAMKHVGVTAQNIDFSPLITPSELLNFAISHYDKPHKKNYLIETFGLRDIANRRMQGFSGGERRRVAIALCFAGNPALVVLDEPTSGLDAKGQSEFQTIIKDYIKSGGSVILTSHYWQEIESISDHIIMIDKGKTILSGGIREIKTTVNVNKISFSCTNPNQFTKKYFLYNKGEYTTTTSDSDSLIIQLISSGQKFTNLKITPRTLEEAINIYRKKQE